MRIQCVMNPPNKIVGRGNGAAKVNFENRTMAQYSMWLTGKFTGDNIHNVVWECSPCHVTIPYRADGIRHIQHEHGVGTLYPKLSEIGKSLAMMHYYQDASPRLAKALVEATDQHFCKGMGAEPTYVTPQNSSERAAQSFTDNRHLFTIIQNLLIEIRHKVEQKKGYVSLTNSNGEARILRSEKEIQVTLQEWFERKCEYLNLDLTREGETGRGLLDFKFSYGNDLQCFLEVKLFESKRLEHGLEIQLPTYLQAQRIRYGIYVPVSIDPVVYESKIEDLRQTIESLNQDTDFEIAMIDIRAWEPESASKVKKLEDPQRYEPVS
jgi:hypothetical protein